MATVQLPSGTQLDEDALYAALASGTMTAAEYKAAHCSASASAWPLPGDKRDADVAAQGVMLTTPSQLVDLQAQANATLDQRRAKSRVAATTFSTAVQDAAEALVGIPSDLLGHSERRSLAAIFAHEDRLRGLGVLLMAVGAAGLLIQKL